MRQHALRLTLLFATLILWGCAIQQGSMPRPQWDPALSSVRPYLEEGAVVTRYRMQPLPEGYLRIVDVKTDDQGKVTSKRYFIWPVAMAAEARKEISQKVGGTLGASSYFEDGKCGVLVVDCSQPKLLSAGALGAFQYEAAPAEASLPEASPAR